MIDQKNFDDNFNNELTHWWFVGRRHIVSSTIDRYVKKSKSPMALDIGCGTAMTVKDLSKDFTSIGFDISYDVMRYAKKREIKNLVCGSAEELPFANESIDLVTMLGVLYNEGIITDDKAICEAFRILKKGGVLIIDEAAYKVLQSRHNISWGGVRRYTRKELGAKMRNAGFKMVKGSYWNMLLLPAMFIAVHLEKIFKNKDRVLKIANTPKLINAILRSYLYLEAAIMKYVDIPCGASVIMVGVK